MIRRSSRRDSGTSSRRVRHFDYGEAAARAPARGPVSAILPMCHNPSFSPAEVPMLSFCRPRVLAAVLALVPGWALAQQHDHDHDHGLAPEKFGKVRFQTSCDAQVQPAFERGMALLHSFAYVKAATVFEEVSAKAPTCGMAQWGVAMTYFHTIWGPPTDNEFTAGRAAAQKAVALGAPTPRERDFIAAIAAYYDGDGVAHPTRVVPYELALPAARAYAKIAPSAPHALHMPSHIFTRMGMWKESIESNLASAQTAQAWLAKTNPGATAFDALHAIDYLEYAYLQTGQDAKARELVDRVAKVTTFDITQFSAGYALAAVPARHALERRAWKEAAALTPQPASFPWAKYPSAEAIVRFASSVGGSRSGNLEVARRELAALTGIQAALKGQKG